MKRVGITVKVFVDGVQVARIGAQEDREEKSDALRDALGVVSQELSVLFEKFNADDDAQRDPTPEPPTAESKPIDEAEADGNVKPAPAPYGDDQ